MSAQGLSAVCPPEETVSIPLDCVALISAAIIPPAETAGTAPEESKPGIGRRMQARALNAFIPGAGTVLSMVKGKMEKALPGVAATDPLLIVELFSGSPQRRLRIDGNRLRYDFLGDKMTPTTLHNFNLLVKGLLVLAPGALKNKGARIIETSRPVREMGYGSLEELERESRCILTPGP